MDISAIAAIRSFKHHELLYPSVLYKAKQEHVNETEREICSIALGIINKRHEDIINYFVSEVGKIEKSMIEIKERIDTLEKEFSKSSQEMDVAIELEKTAPKGQLKERVDLCRRMFETVKEIDRLVNCNNGLIKSLETHSKSLNLVRYHNVMQVAIAQDYLDGSMFSSNSPFTAIKTNYQLPKST